MDVDKSASHATASEAGLSETLSEMQERQAGEGIFMSSPSTVQGTEAKDEDDDESDSKEESDEEDEEASKELQVAEVKGTEPNGGKPKGKGVDG